MKIRSIYTEPARSVHGGTVMQWELFHDEELASPMNVIHANVVNPGVALEPHRHESEEQLFFILGGKGVIRVGDEEKEVGEGDAIYLPPRLEHTIKNIGTYPLRFLAIGARM